MGQACFTSFNGICAEKGIHTQHRLQMQRAWGDPYVSDIRVPFWNNRSMSCSDQGGTNEHIAEARRFLGLNAAGPPS